MVTGSDHGPASPRREAQRAKYVACLPLSSGSNPTATGFLVNLPKNFAASGSTTGVVPTATKI